MDNPSQPSRERAAGPPLPGAGRERRRDPGWRTPALFLGHGSPRVVIDEPYRQALRRFGARLREPRGLVVFSAHWTAIRPLRVTGSRTPALLRDGEGFPNWNDVPTWKCKGSPALADEVITLLNASGLRGVVDVTHGLDSGVWIPLSMMFPGGRSAVVQISLPAASHPAELREIGRALAPLRRKGVMVVGSGGVVHNPALARFDLHDPPTEPWALAFDSWVRDQLDALDEAALHEYRVRGPQAHLAAPSSEHLDPLFVVLGTIMPGDRVVHIYEGFHAGNLSLRSFALMGQRATDARLPDALTAGAAA